MPLLIKIKKKISFFRLFSLKNPIIFKLKLINLSANLKGFLLLIT